MAIQNLEHEKLAREVVIRGLKVRIQEEEEEKPKPEVKKVQGLEDEDLENLEESS